MPSPRAVAHLVQAATCGVCLLLLLLETGVTTGDGTDSAPATTDYSLRTALLVLQLGLAVQAVAGVLPLLPQKGGCAEAEARWGKVGSRSWPPGVAAVRKFLSTILTPAYCCTSAVEIRTRACAWFCPPPFCPVTPLNRSYKRCLPAAPR